MKTIKRSIAFVLAMVLTLAMSVTVFAEGEGVKKTFTITVNEAKAGHTYEAYQILKGDLSKSQTTLSNVDWGTGIKADKKTEPATVVLKTDAIFCASALISEEFIPESFST